MAYDIGRRIRNQWEFVIQYSKPDALASNGVNFTNAIEIPLYTIQGKNNDWKI